MHLDPTVIAFGTAIVSLTTAITGLVRSILEKKSASGAANAPQKKLKSVPRGIPVLEKTNLVTLCAAHHGSLQKKLA